MCSGDPIYKSMCRCSSALQTSTTSRWNKRARRGEICSMERHHVLSPRGELWAGRERAPRVPVNVHEPAITLCYPLLASILAVETGSGYHMRKMVEYWTLFSLFSLFEISFVKINECEIPFWSGVRLAVSLLLVMPQFEGAGIAYQGLVRSFIHMLGIFKEERLRKRKGCLNAVEKYIEENESEALEKLVVSQMTPPEARVQNTDPETPLLNKSEQEARMDTGVGESMLNAHLQGSKHKSKPEFKGRMPTKEPESSHLNKAWQEGFFDLCKVTTKNKSMWNAHLQGSEHKSKLESLKASLLDAKNTGPFSRLHMEPVSEAEDIMPPKETAERRLETPLKKAQPEWTGDVCKVTTVKASLLEAKDTGSSSLQQVQHMQPVSAFEEEDIMPPKEIAEKGLPETPILEKAQQEWTSDRCKATNDNESMLSNQKSKLERILEASLSLAKDTVSSPLVAYETQPTTYFDFVCASIYFKNDAFISCYFLKETTTILNLRN
ncbi:hypothetical protein SASPL_118516 [Salvia splendens]|uniref:C2H2-type domain-containing protein n=1 Tax=Salvia splendens TaxID=180675 RepID=A0A8X8XWX0_SALSN|nr:hypothetical protein SASPL_118516 [Salvia splendens]